MSRIPSESHPNGMGPRTSAGRPLRTARPTIPASNLGSLAVPFFQAGHSGRTDAEVQRRRTTGPLVGCKDGLVPIFRGHHLLGGSGRIRCGPHPAVLPPAYSPCGGHAPSLASDGLRHGPQPESGLTAQFQTRAARRRESDQETEDARPLGRTLLRAAWSRLKRIQ